MHEMQSSDSLVENGDTKCGRFYIDLTGFRKCHQSKLKSTKCVFEKKLELKSAHDFRDTKKDINVRKRGSMVPAPK